MTQPEQPTPTDAAAPEPGDRPPARVLARPPGERYAAPDAPEHAGSAREPVGRVLLTGAAGALAGAAILVVLAVPLSVTTGLLIVAPAVGWGIGLAVKAGGGFRLGAGRSAAVAAALAIAACVVAWGVTWAWSRVTGGALAPTDFLAEVYGWLVPAQVFLTAAGAIVGSR